MSVLQANCPSCAGQIEFKSGASVVVVCPFCRSAVARTDRALEDLGKVAEIAESESPLRIGLRGIFRENRFELTGRAQLQHEAGGFWDEWYATFSNGWTGWLAEAQGRFYLTFQQSLGEGAQIPPFQNLQLGQTVPQIPSKTPLLVAEKGIAAAVAADGEIPYKLVPNERSYYADLSGAGGAFATIDYSANPPQIYAGQQVTLNDLGLADARAAERAPRVTSAARMNCPNCAGPLELRAPDKAERVTCPNCDSLLDVNQGNLKWLRALVKTPEANPFVLNIGQKGVFRDGSEMTIIGAMTRSVSVDGTNYFWHEYLLYNAKIGFRWLVHSDNHWNFIEPVNVAEVVVGGNSATYDGRTFKVFQDAPARVEAVRGEFYWRVEQGETVRAVDYVQPPLMLSCEMNGSEINWSRGTYLTNREVEKAFAVENLPAPWNVAPNQPFTGGFYIKYGFLMLGILIAAAIFMIPFSGSSKTVLSENLTLARTASESAPQTVFSQPFELKGSRNVKISASAPVDNSAAYLDVALVNEQNNNVESVEIPISYYQGVEDGESWKEGNQNNDVTLSSLPAGKYTLRVEGTLENARQPIPVSVKVEQNVTRGVNFWLAFVAISLLPIFAVFRKWMFESRRWGESMFITS